MKLKIVLTLALAALLLVTSYLFTETQPPGELVLRRATPSPVGRQPERPRRPVLPEEATVYLSDLPWQRATTGWVALADDHLPKLDTSFPGAAITIGEKRYDRGIGTYPLSEIVYALGGKYRLFQAEVGVDGTVPPDAGSVIFKLFLDDVLVYDSGVLRSGVPPQPVEQAVDGVDQLKLVVEDAGDGATLDFANWADARLASVERGVALPPDLPGALADAARRLGEAALALSRGEPIRTAGQLRRQLELTRQERQQSRNEDWASVQQRSAAKLSEVAGVLAAELSPGSQLDPSVSLEQPAFPVEASAVFDPEHRQIVLLNDRLAVTLGYGGDRHGLLDVLDLETGTLVANHVTPSITTRDLSTLVLSRHTVSEDEGGYRFQRVDDPVLGPGMEVNADFRVPAVEATVSVRLALFDDQSYLTYQLELRDVADDTAVDRFTFFDGEKGGYFVLGEEAAYLTDNSLPRRGEIRDDSIARKELVGLGKPAVVYDTARSRGLVMGLIDEVDDPARFNVQLQTGHVSGRLSFEHQAPQDVRASRLQSSPRLFLQPTDFSDMQSATAQFRRVMQALYPPPPIPDWVKYQWGSWYAFYMNYDEATIKEQIDYIAENLADLGPWSILLDAGWYVAEGRPGSGWVPDPEKFPYGLRSLVNYAHSRDIKVVLYFSAPYLDDREREGNWLGLRGFIEQHPDWVIQLQSDSSGSSYVYDFTNPGLVDYVRGLIDEFFQSYGVDGIKIDGLGQAEGEQLSQEERDIFGDVNTIRMFTMDVYRLIYEEATGSKSDAYIESGWAIPSFANRYAHTFRYGDEFPEFENRYPASGLLEHIDYATLQKTVIGQRPNMGMVWGGPESQRMIRSWFEAALAMGTQMTLSTDLTRLSSRDLSALRSLLVHYNAFQGDTRFVGMPFADSFATTANGITYLGAVNRGTSDEATGFDLPALGLEPGKGYLLYDVSANRYRKVQDSFSAILSPGSFHLFLLRDSPGVMWTNSSTRVESGEHSLNVEVAGPSSITGSLQLYTPPPFSVRLDGRELSRSIRASEGGSYSYDQATGVLRLRYHHDRPHTVEVDY